MSSCDNDNIGLGGSQTPENIFSGNEWESKYINHEGLLLHYFKLSFTTNGFTLYEKTDYPASKNENTFTGTYNLSVDDIFKSNILVLKSDIPTLSGQIYYEYYKKNTEVSMYYGEPAQEGDLIFYGTPTGSTVKLPNKFTKIN